MATQYVILAQSEDSSNGLAPIGSRDEIIEGLSRFNTAPERNGDDALYGPGIRIDLTPGEDPIRQMLLSVMEEEIAWLVIIKLAKHFKWRIVDMSSGRELSPG